jgi:hypothetical protein
MSTRTYNLGATGLTLHAKLLAVATDYWVLQATGATEAYNVDHLTDYQHSGSEPEMPGCYVFTISDNLAAGFYRIYIYNLDGIVIAKRLEYWDGTEWVSVNEGVAAAKTAAEAVNNLTKAGAAGDLAEIASNVAEALATVGTTGVVLTTEERSAVAAALLDLASAIDGKTVREALRYIAATGAGEMSGGGTGTVSFKGLDKSTTRVTGTVDDNGNRSSITYDP